LGLTERFAEEHRFLNESSVIWLGRQVHPDLPRVPTSHWPSSLVATHFPFPFQHVQFGIRLCTSRRAALSIFNTQAHHDLMTYRRRSYGDFHAGDYSWSGIHQRGVWLIYVFRVFRTRVYTHGFIHGWIWVPFGFAAPTDSWLQQKVHLGL